MKDLKSFIQEARKGSPVNWTEVLRSGGYYHVIPDISNWSEMHTWCNEQFGSDRYAWNGSNFWFETEKDAMLFLLKWGSTDGHQSFY